MAKSEEPIVTATIDYERWVKKHVAVYDADLQKKHEEMATSLFAFLRATFYRWASLWSEVCPGLAETPRVLAVGDLHVENFGTWRDVEGRLVWGVNDFDEVARMPYTVDLTRLTTSAILAKRENGLAIDPSDAATAVLEGYIPPRRWQSLHPRGKPSQSSLHGLECRARSNSVLEQIPRATAGVTAEGHSPIAQAVVTPGSSRHRILTPYCWSGQPWSAAILSDCAL